MLKLVQSKILSEEQREEKYVKKKDTKVLKDKWFLLNVYK